MRGSKRTLAKAKRITNVCLQNIQYSGNIIAYLWFASIRRIIIFSTCVCLPVEWWRMQSKHLLHSLLLYPFHPEATVFHFPFACIVPLLRRRGIISISIISRGSIIFPRGHNASPSPIEIMLRRRTSVSNSDTQRAMTTDDEIAKKDPCSYTGSTSPSFIVDDSQHSSLPSHSRGIYFGGFEQPVYEKSERLNRPSSQSQVVLVKVHAVGLNPVDAKHAIGDKLPYNWTSLRRVSHNLLVKDTRVGFDFAGTVVQENHPTFPEGTRVYGSMPPLGGSCADYIYAPIHQIAKASNMLRLEEWAALPLVGLTAWQALSPHIVRDESKVLIIGGSGGTGHVALQVAKALGAKELITICSTRNIDFVKKCGATQVIDYREHNDDGVVEELRQYGPLDVILDCVTSADPEDARHRYPEKVRTTTGVVSSNHLYQRLGGQCSDWIRAGLARLNVFPHSWLWKDSHERLFWIRFPHSSHELEELTKMVDSGQLRPKIQKTYNGLTAETVQQAFDDIKSRRVQGKVVVKVCSDDE